MSSFLRLFKGGKSSRAPSPSPSGKQEASSRTTSRRASQASIRPSVTSPDPTGPILAHKHTVSRDTNGTSSDSSSQRYHLPVPILILPSGEPSPDTEADGPPQSPATPPPENELRALASLGIQCALSIAQVASELAPVPYIGPLVGCLTKVFEAIEQSRVNKEQWSLLQGRCVMVMRIAATRITNNGESAYPGLDQASQHLASTLNTISKSARHYNEMNNIRALLMYNYISEEIEGHFTELDSCLTFFSFAANVAQEQWANDFRIAQQKESADLHRICDLLLKLDIGLDDVKHGVAGIDHGISRIIAKLDDNAEATSSRVIEALRQELAKQHDVLQDQDKSVASHADAEQIVRTILSVTNLGLPPKLLVGRQCALVSTLPIKAGLTCDVYRAKFLGGEEVAKKVFRLGTSEEEMVQNYARRFIRIAELWHGFASPYTLRFHGIGMESIEGGKYFQL